MGTYTAINDPIEGTWQAQRTTKKTHKRIACMQGDTFSSGLGVEVAVVYGVKNRRERSNKTISTWGCLLLFKMIY